MLSLVWTSNSPSMLPVRPRSYRRLLSSLTGTTWLSLSSVSPDTCSNLLLSLSPEPLPFKAGYGHFQDYFWSTTWIIVLPHQKIFSCFLPSWRSPSEKNSPDNTETCSHAESLRLETVYLLGFAIQGKAICLYFVQLPFTGPLPQPCWAQALTCRDRAFLTSPLHWESHHTLVSIHPDFVS